MSAKQFGYITKKTTYKPRGGAKCTCSFLLKKFLSLILSVLVVGMSLPHVAWADAPTSGDCGDNVTWSLNLDNGTLTISGEGNMRDFWDAPWYDLKDKITSVVIEDGVTSIGSHAFWDCTNLTSVTIPNSVNTIEVNAFTGCSKLTAIKVASENTKYKDIYGVLFNKDGTTLIKYPGGKSSDYTIPDGVTSIADYAFDGCSGLESVTIPSSVNTIGTGAFAGCSGLKSVTIPSTVTEIKVDAFAGCSGLESVTIPSRVTSIGARAFYGCSGLKSVTISSTVTEIGNSAFNRCSKLESIVIPCDFDKGIFTKNSLGINLQDGDTYTVSYTGDEPTTGEFKYVHSIDVDGEITDNNDGTHSFKCNRDGCCKKDSENIVTEAHSFGDWVVTDTNHYKECIYCQARIEEEPHEFEYVANEDGSTHTGTCKCGKTEPEEHYFGDGDWVVTDTNHYKECICGAKKDEAIHSFGDWLKTDTKHYKECICGAKKDEADHSFKYVANENGTHTGTCKCGKTVEDEAHSPTHVPAKAATCTEAGNTEHYKCSKCSSLFSDNEGKNKTTLKAVTKKALGHSFTTYIYNNDATCTEDGTETATCDNEGCNEKDTITKVGSALGHKYDKADVAPTKTNLGGTKHRCEKCGDEYWTDFKKDDAYAQTRMPNGDTIHQYCRDNDLEAETTVDVGDGQTLKVFLEDPLRALKKDNNVLDINVQYVQEGSDRYNELMSQVDGDHPIEHIKFFDVNPTVKETVNVKTVTGKLDQPVYMEYEIPDGWDKEDLEMILVHKGDDQEFDETVIDRDGKKYLAMWKNHFSPYAMIDKLSEKEQAELDKQKNEQNLQSLSQMRTGDETGYMIFVSALICAAATLVIFKKKKVR